MDGTGKSPFMRWTFKFEMELLPRAAGFKRWQIRGGFYGRPLASENDRMVTFAQRQNFSVVIST